MTLLWFCYKGLRHLSSLKTTNILPAPATQPTYAQKLGEGQLLIRLSHISNVISENAKPGQQAEANITLPGPTEIKPEDSQGSPLTHFLCNHPGPIRFNRSMASAYGGAKADRH